MITFQEHPETGYAMRTWDNARLSDLTIAFAIDFNTPGEILTRKAAYGKYLPVHIKEPYALDLENNEDLKECIRFILRKRTKVLNIAGNGIYTLGKQKWCQQGIDYYIEVLLKYIFNFSDIPTIRSGGQTGVDEAALKAGDKLGLETICLAPKNWMFRDITGRDICSENLFLKRFGPQYDVTDIL